MVIQSSSSGPPFVACCSSHPHTVSVVNTSQRAPGGDRERHPRSALAFLPPSRWERLPPCPVAARRPLVPAALR
jgi:hypothetical protein